MNFWEAIRKAFFAQSEAVEGPEEGPLGLSPVDAATLKVDQPDGYASTIITPGRSQESWRDKILREEAEEGWRRV